MDIDADRPLLIEHDGRAALLLIVPHAAMPSGPERGVCQAVEAGWAPVEDPVRLVLDVLWRASRPGADHHVRLTFDLTIAVHRDAVDQLAFHGTDRTEVTLYLSGDPSSQQHAARALLAGELTDRHTLASTGLDCRPLTLLDVPS